MNTCLLSMAPRIRETVTRSILPQVLHHEAKHEDMPMLATASSITEVYGGLPRHGRPHTPASTPTGRDTPKRRPGAVMDHVLEGGLPSLDAADAPGGGGRRVRSRAGQEAAGMGLARSESMPSCSRPPAADQPRMSALMVTVLRQSLGIPEPSMHAVARLHAPDGCLRVPACMPSTAAHVAAFHQAAAAGLPGTLASMDSVGSGSGSAIILPRATCRGPSILTSQKSA